MDQNITALHHLHKRKRVYKKIEEYPHPNKFKRIMDNVVLAVGILGPIVSLPQLLKIWMEQSARGVSLVSWMGYTVGAAVMLVYAIAHKEKPLIVTYGGWLLFEVAIVITILNFTDGFTL